MTTSRADRMTRGAHWQPYLAAFRGTADERLAAYTAGLDAWKALGGVGVVLHDPGSVANTQRLARPALDRGLQVSVAHGLGQRDSLAPEQAAARVARLAMLPEVTASVIDAETAWRNDATDVAAAARLGAELRRLCPDALFVGQFVAVLQNSGAEARRFGRREFLAWCDALAPMLYANYSYKRDATGRFVPTKPEHGGKYDPRRAKVFSRWRAKQATLGADLGVPQTWQSWQTLQGYGWNDITADLTDVLLRAVDGVTLVWAEPRWDETFAAGMRVVQALAEVGYTGPDAVLEFQKWSNGTGTMVPLVEDGIAGPKTRKAIGVP